MNDPRNISIENYDYDLPVEKIASYPLVHRDASKLLIYNRSDITEDTYKNLSTHIPGDSLLIFNNTKVVEARLLFQKPTGGVIEIFCLEPAAIYPDITTALTQQQKVQWNCLVGGASKWKRGQVLKKIIEYEGKQVLLEAHYIDKLVDSFIIEFSWEPASLPFSEILHVAGAIPLPPYIKRAAEVQDAQSYQTVYAKTGGSVAAPTAGLHFTESIFESLQNKKIKTAYMTLHVGAGTFKPVKAQLIGNHEMHAEWIDVDLETIESILTNLNTKIVAVGTTSLRTIETLYWLGVKIKEEMSGQHFLDQWEANELENLKVSVEESLYALIESLKKNNQHKLVAKTRILIAPGYQFKIVDGLITNFHQPRSTLLLLIAAFIGEDWKKIYDYALKNNFRFLSYGDGNLIWRT